MYSRVPTQAEQARLERGLGPYTQYFDPPFALHAAFWHDRFGEPTSAGCVNVSPADAQLLFEWSDPPVPEDWQGAGARENGPMTAIVIRR